MAADHRIPEDTLFMLFEEDYRFWPLGEDPDKCDTYQERLKKRLEDEERSKAGASRPDDWHSGAARSGAQGSR